MSLYHPSVSHSSAMLESSHVKMVEERTLPCKVVEGECTPSWSRSACSLNISSVSHSSAMLESSHVKNG